MKTKNLQHDHSAIQQQHEQHFINGIGDGKLFKSMDLPDPNRRRYMRKRFHKKHDENFGGHHPIDYERSAKDRRDNTIPNDIPQDPRMEPGDNIDLPVIKLFTILGLFVAVSFISNLQASRSRRKIKSKLKRTDSLLVRQKKKTDEWGEDGGDYRDYQSDMKIAVPVRDPSPIYLDLREGNKFYNRKRSGSENRARLRRPSVAMKTEEVLPRQHAYRGGGLDGLDGFDGFDITNPPIENNICGGVDDEEMPSPRPSPRGSLKTSSTSTSLDTDADVGLEVDADEETPTTSTKPTIYVDSFAQLTMPNISTSPTHVSNRNTKFDSFLDEVEVSRSFSKAESSGETEGANGILHKRKDLTACSDAASSLHSPITFSELKMDSLIGGGGFGQVWRATWRGTPVAVKVLSSSSQAYNVQKTILQEFAAEINMLSGMRHPNICLYIGACLEPSNRAIVTGKRWVSNGYCFIIAFSNLKKSPSNRTRCERIPMGCIADAIESSIYSY
jgi:hypothetical protein